MRALPDTRTARRDGCPLLCPLFFPHTSFPRRPPPFPRAVPARDGCIFSPSAMYGEARWMPLISPRPCPPSSPLPLRPAMDAVSCHQPHTRWGAMDATPLPVSHFLMLLVSFVSSSRDPPSLRWMHFLWMPDPDPYYCTSPPILPQRDPPSPRWMHFLYPPGTCAEARWMPNPFPTMLPLVSLPHATLPPRDGCIFLPPRDMRKGVMGARPRSPTAPPCAPLCPSDYTSPRWMHFLYPKHMR